MVFCPFVGLVCVLLLTAGCGLFFKDDEGLFADPRDDYIDATEGRPLRVPEGMQASVGDTWPIPEVVEQPTSKTYVGEVPRPRFLAGANVDAIKIQKLGSKSWIVLADAPEQVWPLVKQLIVDSNVDMEREDPTAGIVETAWFRADSAAPGVLGAAVRTGLAEAGETAGGTWLDRVQVRIERGIRFGSSEVHVVHYRSNSGGESDAVETSAVAAVEAELITQIADYFAEGVAAGSVSMVGRDIASESKARIVEGEGGVPTLVLNIGFDRAWATVDGALQRAEMVITESDRENATFRAVVPDDRRPGFFARVFAGGPREGTAITIRLHVGTDSVVVEVQDGSGQPISRELAERVLLTLREFAA